MSAVSVSEITAPFRPLRDYSSLSLYVLSAMTLPEYKKLDFVLERGQNLGKVALSDTKTPILCSSRRGIGIGKRKMAFLQITAHALKT